MTYWRLLRDWAKCKVQMLGELCSQYNTYDMHTISFNSIFHVVITIHLNMTGEVFINICISPCPSALKSGAKFLLYAKPIIHESCSH